MKKTLFLSALIAFAIICSCQKQDSAAEAQLAQRKTELDLREKALVQREKAVDEREKAAPDAAQAEAERIQQLPPEVRALIQAQKKKGIGGAFASPAAEVPQADASGAGVPVPQADAPAAEVPVPQADAPAPAPSPTPQ